MWTRALLKNNAKQALKGRYWRAFWICLVLSLLGVSGIAAGTNSGARSTISVATGDTSEQTLESALDTVPGSILGAVLGVSIFVLVIGLILSFCWSVFVVNPLEIGRARYFMESRQSLTPAETVVSVFRTPYLNVVKVTLLTNLKVFLGFLLLIVPGVYWQYCYALVPYLLAENPYMTTSRAMELSKEIMNGEKWNFFVLKLSFIGWELLCALTFGIGGFFLEPYIQATNAEFYAAMRSKAFALNLTDSNELGGFVRHDGNP